jgi:hypothetical protein
MENFYSDKGILFKTIYDDGGVEYRSIDNDGKYSQIIEIKGDTLTISTDTTKRKFVNGALVEEFKTCIPQEMTPTFKPPSF